MSTRPDRKSYPSVSGRYRKGAAARFLFLPALALLALMFSAGSSASATPEEARAVARLYSAAFNREPDSGGLNFWISSLEQGQSLAAIARAFRESPEFERRYGALENVDFVRQLYRNILGREGEASGVAFWVSRLEDGSSQALVLREFSESPEHRRKTDDLFAEMHRRGQGVWTYDPVSGRVKSSGTINAFGSIFVNGIEFETDDADIWLDGEKATEDELRLGMVVTVEGIINDDGRTGTAIRVEFDDDVQGPITAIEPGRDGDALLLTILGLQVIAERTGTVFDDTSFETLAVGDVLEVSGFVDDRGRLRATRVELKNGDSEVERKGIVKALVGTEFMLGDYVVDFSGADLSGVEGGVISEGMGVEVHGTLADSRITADRVEEEDDVGGRFDDDDEVEFEGAITNLVDGTRFELSGVAVDASSAILRPSGLVLAEGVVVQVEGHWEAGVLVARKIEARRGRVEIEASVSSVDLSQGTVTLQLFGLAAVTVTVDARTLLDDDTDDDVVLTLEDIAAGDFLEVEAIQVGNTLVATRIDREDGDDEVLQARVGSFNAGVDITLLGVTYATTGAEFESRSGKSLTADEFYSQLQVGDLVKVKDRGTADGVADKVEFERSRALDGDDCESDHDDCTSEDEDDSADVDDDSADDDDEDDDSDDDSDDDDDDEDDIEEGDDD